ncbi:MAG: hypothetical protein K2N71_10605 [Oscillospiraceae bacterium]|nr:hypothetical protein [Oscillospiraceae bacterium]
MLSELRMIIGIVVYPAVMIGIVVLLQKVPAKLNANESFVEFVFLFYRVKILYSDIKSIEVKNEYVEGSFRGEKPRYEEVITIVCKDREYCFDNIMEFEVGRFEANPVELAMQFRRGTFRRLKDYISKQTDIELKFVKKELLLCQKLLIGELWQQARLPTPLQKL